MKQKKGLYQYLKKHVSVIYNKKGSKLRAVGNNQIWNNKKQLLFVCMIIRDNIGFEVFLKP